MSGSSQLPYDGAGDSRAGDLSLADRFRRHADSLRRSSRSPLYQELMRAAAEDIDGNGVVAVLFETVPTPPGSVPQLRLLAALHYLVLSGRASALAAFYPSAGGQEPVDGVWLLEIGASAGLNLQVDRYCYVVGEDRLGDPASPLRFVEPWAPPPPIDLDVAAHALRIVDRAALAYRARSGPDRRAASLGVARPWYD